MSRRNGWKLYSHPRFTDQYNRLTLTVAQEELRAKTTNEMSLNMKLRKAIRDLIFNRIPSDPTNTAFRQAKTLGSRFQHWFRAKFGNGRFRLFFRYDQASRTVVYAWINDDTTLRTYGSKRDAYAVFARMFHEGDPPDSWAELLKASKPMEDDQ